MTPVLRTVPHSHPPPPAHPEVSLSVRKYTSEFSLYLYSNLLFQESHKPSPFPWCTRRIHRNQHTAVLMVMIYYRERILEKLAKRKGTWNQIGGYKSLHKAESHRLIWIFQYQIVTTHVKYYLPGSSLKTQWPGILLESGHIGILCLVHTKIPDPQKERRYSI